MSDAPPTPDRPARDPARTALAEAEAAQATASDPRLSAWVGASAGTGKTTVLTRRVLRLLLDGAPPRRVLCLTFTKAAAAEMRNRIADRLSRWAALPSLDLAEDLAAVLGMEPSAGQRLIARRLFATVLDEPGGLTIETLHAFCQSVLRRFPLEAGMPPHFELMDDRAAEEALLEAREALLRDAQSPEHGRQSDTGLAEALATVTAEIGEEGFSDLMQALAGERGRLKRLRARRSDLAEIGNDLARVLGLAPNSSVGDVLADACRDGAFDRSSLSAVADALLQGSKTDKERGQRIADWLATSPAERASGFETYGWAYLKKSDGELLKTLATKACLTRMPVAGAVLRREAERVRGVTDRCRSVGLLANTSALLRLAFGLLDRYERRKATRAQLDYDDLILATERLLHSGTAWVQYKLDGGIDHILIDEAQDTNPDQWAIVEALAADFFTGLGARDSRRTVFAVGDVKQSIYSFQRADPQAFTGVRDRFGARIAAAARRADPIGSVSGWADVPMRTSFRSTDAVLQAVDATFAAGAARAGVELDGRTVEHAAARAGHAGLVQLWPVFRPGAATARDPWQTDADKAATSVMDGPVGDPHALLAAAIARQVRNWLDGSDVLESEGRPIRPGDVMVLVRRRTGFVEELVRQLKARDIPVAGVDRMVLTDQLAVMDLLVLGEFLLLPRDDLALATVLKGPLIGLSEDQLMTLAAAPGRPDLWRQLRAWRDDDPAFATATAFLEALLARVDHVPPFELFADILAAPCPQGPSGRAALLGRLGMQADDPIEEFMALALAHQRNHAPSLQGFVQWIRATETDIKRDLEQAIRDEVRVMTVHGAKGLQAPIVFLPDTTTAPPDRQKLFWLPLPGANRSDDRPLGHDDEILPLWSPRAASDDATAASVRLEASAARMAEYARLLYVAMTRAEDRLYVCGAAGRRNPPADCWYRMAAEGLARLGPSRVTMEDGRTYPALAPAAPADPDEPFEVRSYRRAQRIAATPDAAAPGSVEPAPTRPPDWAFRTAPPERTPARPLAASAADTDEPAVHSPLGQPGDRGRFKRGLLVHRLLQSLPDLPEDRRRAVAEHWLASPVHSLDHQQRRNVLDETLAVMTDPGFAPLFAPDSRAEVPVTGVVMGPGANGTAANGTAANGLVPRVIAARIDRLAVLPDRVLIVDYKTLRPPPTDPVRVSPVYRRQMAAYRALIEAIYPDRPVDCALLWTDGPRLMPLPAALLDAEGFAPMPHET